MASHVMAVYNTVEDRIEQMVIDNTNYTDPSFNPPGCVQVYLDPQTYEAVDGAEGLLALVRAKAQS